MSKIIFAFVVAAFSHTVCAAPESYSIDPTHSAARYGYDHLSWTYQQHRFDQMTGKIAFDRAAKSAAVEVVIDAKSINTGYSVFNGHMQAEDMLDTAKFPVITYKSTGVKFDGDKVISIDGDLTIKGITKPVTLTVTSFASGPHPAQKKRESIGANAVAKIKRSDFGLVKQIPVIADEIALSFTIQAFKD